MIEISGAVKEVTTAPAPVPGTGVRDAVAAALVAAILCAGAANLAERTRTGALGAVLGVAIAGAAGWSVVARPGRWSGPADRVTLLRAAMIGGCAALGLLVAAGELPQRPWPLFVLLVPTLALDAVDGVVARRTGSSSPAGGKLDGEMDAALLMVLSIAAVPALGWWVLAIGLMRYVFWVAGSLRPRQRGHLAFSQFRRVVAALQGIMFAVALAPVLPQVLGQICVAVALALLTVSFGIDVVHLERRGRSSYRDPALHQEKS